MASPQSTGVEKPGLEPEAQVFGEYVAQVGLALRLPQELEGAHLGAALGPGADLDGAAELELAEARIAVAARHEERAVRAEAAAAIRPLFVSHRYGEPGFGQLELRCAEQIRTGAESGAEMGAFEFLKQPQREANLRDVLAEYLRFGLEAGLFYVS